MPRSEIGRLSLPRWVPPFLRFHHMLTRKPADTRVFPIQTEAACLTSKALRPLRFYQILRQNELFPPSAMLLHINLTNRNFKPILNG